VGRVGRRTGGGLAHRFDQPVHPRHRTEAAAELALRIAEETDARVAELPLDRMASLDPESPIYPARAEHRGKPRDELEGALPERS
jgi:hypothetical protein